MSPFEKNFPYIFPIDSGKIDDIIGGVVNSYYEIFFIYTSFYMLWKQDYRNMVLFYFMIDNGKKVL